MIAEAPSAIPEASAFDNGQAFEPGAGAAHDIALLETSRTKWQYGEWRDLAAISLEQVDAHPDRARIALLIGAAKAQLGEFDAARTALRCAANWGCGRRLIAKVLASAVHNSLGRVAACLDDDDGSTRHFEAAIELVEPRADTRLMARTRRIRETARLGLLRDSARLVGEDLSAAKTAPIDHASRLSALRLELDLIDAELAQTTQALPDPGAEPPDHPIFDRFPRATCETSGRHIYDFLGGATATAFNANWSHFALDQGKATTPSLPPKNEHYLDWIAVLTAAAKARGVFRMAELGAGWAPWLVRGAIAARQAKSAEQCELLGVEADATHYSWAREHFLTNGLDPDAHHLLHGAVADRAGVVRFPVVMKPDQDYSAALADSAGASETVEVQGYGISDLLSRFSGPVDLIHIDIQGAEHDALPPALSVMAQSVRAVMIGTHGGDGPHQTLAELFRCDGWRERLNLGHSRAHRTPWGEIVTDDGFLWFENSREL